jgi:DNA topoisomerase-3
MKTYLKVPYDEKDEAKKNGARWDNDKKLWYIVKGIKTLEKYIIETLEVDYDDKDKVKKLGAFWNNENKTWNTTRGNLELNPELQEYC